MSAFPSTLEWMSGMVECHAGFVFIFAYHLLFYFWGGLGAGFCISAVGVMVLNIGVRKVDVGFPLPYSLRDGNRG